MALKIWNEIYFGSTCSDPYNDSYWFASLAGKAVDPDPHGSEFNLPPKSGSRRDQLKTEKGKEITNNCSFIQFF